MKKTAVNLIFAFMGESQARNRYSMFGKIAKKEGYTLISKIFEETANHEKEHANWDYKMLQQLKEEEHFEDLEIKAAGPTTYGNSIENLKSAIKGENYEWQEMYPGFADVAQEEGYLGIAERLRKITRAEQYHSERYGKLLKLVEDGAFFKRGEKTVWICMKCGYEEEMEELPADWVCPSCDHDRSHFRKKCEDF